MSQVIFEAFEIVKYVFEVFIKFQKTNFRLKLTFLWESKLTNLNPFQPYQISLLATFDLLSIVRSFKVKNEKPCQGYFFVLSYNYIMTDQNLNFIAAKVSKSEKTPELGQYWQKRYEKIYKW